MSGPPSLRVIGPGERVPPASIEAERACIGAVLLREELLVELDELVVDDFFLPAHRAIWEAIRTLTAAGKKVDAIGLEDELRMRGDLMRLEGGVSYLVGCADSLPHLEGASRHGLMVREKARLRRMIQLCAEFQSRAYGEFGDVNALLGEARDRFAEIENCGPGQGPVRVGDEITAALEVIEARARHPELYSVQTGILRFDRRIGGLVPERLICVAAAPGVGKSAWAGTVATNAAKRGIHSLIISLEMSRQELHERFFAGEGKLPVKDLVTGEVCRQHETASRLFDAARSFENDPIFIDDRDTLTIREVVGTIRRWYAKDKGETTLREVLAVMAGSRHTESVPS